MILSYLRRMTYGVAGNRNASRATLALRAVIFRRFGASTGRAAVHREHAGRALTSGRRIGLRFGASGGRRRLPFARGASGGLSVVSRP